jgi:hypothetical protein
MCLSISEATMYLVGPTLSVCTLPFAIHRHAVISAIPTARANVPAVT